MVQPEVSAAVCLHLRRLQEGDCAAVDDLMPYVYGDLREIAKRLFAQRGRDQTLQPTALVHEAYMRLVGAAQQGWESRRHFLAVAAIAMRQLLANYAEGRRTQKRGGDRSRVVLDAAAALQEGEDGLDLVALHDALSRLESKSARQARVVELRFLAGLTLEETAAVLEVSPRTVGLDWQFARAWLRRELADSVEG